MLQTNALPIISQTCDADEIGSPCSSNHWVLFGAIHTLFTKHTTNEWETQKKLQTHKQFSLDMIMELLLRSQKFKTAETCDANSFPADSPIKRSLSLISTASAKRTVSKYHNKRQIQKDNPEAIFDLFPRRFLKPMNLHALIPAPHGSRGRCVWCRVIYQEKQSNDMGGNYNNEVKKARKVCSFCSSKNNNCFLCHDHFVTFHGE